VVEVDLGVEAGGETEEKESESARHARHVRSVIEWADAQPDDDTWEGFYLSVDLIEDIPGDESS
jgi:COMPASS component SWD1